MGKNELFKKHQDLLCDSMVMCIKDQNSGNAFYSLPGESFLGYEAVWPVSEKLLGLYTPEKLNKMLSVKREKDSVSVTLNLDVMGKMRKHSVTKTYRIKNIGDDDRRAEGPGICSIFEVRRLPFWAVWPYVKVSNNQSASAWQRYTFFCVDHIYNNAPVFAIEPFFPDEAGGLEKSKLSAINVKGREFFYRRCKVLPNIFKIFEQTGGVPKYCGIVFLNPPEEKHLGTAIWNVGVDFGTTSTSIYYNDGTKSPDFLQLLTEYHWRAGKNDEPEIVGKLESSLEILCNSGDEDFLDKYFIDKQCLSQKGYTTTFEELNAKDGEDETLFDSGRIFWHNYKNFKDVNAVLGRREHLKGGMKKSGIKWESNKKWASRYLNQMLTQVSYRAIEEGASEIHWFFSYPTAFSSGDRDTFKERLITLIKKLREETGINHKFDGEGSLLTESVAVAHFFRKKHPDYVTFLCLDIGGSTSDISIWANKELVFQTSIKFASREMFVEPLQKLLEHPAVMEKVCTSDVTDGIHTMLRYDGKDADKENIPFLIETVLFEYLESFKNRLDDLQSEDKQAYRHFKYLVYTAYAGLIFYLANIIVGLLDDIRARLSNDDSQIVLGLSGKGSRLTEWIPMSWCRSIYKTAEAIIKERTGYDITFKVPPFQADAAKTETAYGLICNPINQNGKRNSASDADTIDPKIFMGCCISVNDSQATRYFGGDEFVKAYDPFFKKPEKLTVQLNDRSLSDFDQFIDFLNRVSEEARNEVEAVPEEWYNDKEKKALLSKMGNYLNNHTLGEEHRFDPPFIAMLKVFLREYSEYLYEKK